MATADHTSDGALDETVESDSGDTVATTIGSGAPVERAGAVPVPDHIGRYRIISRLGAGGMGIVLLASDPVLGRHVAIKILHADRDANEPARQRLLREAQGMAQLAHENIIVVHEVGTHGDRVYLAMEYVKGMTLGRWQHGRDWREVLAAYVRAGRGLQAAHEAGLVHRDFKPDNVLVGDDGRIRVTDFGLVASTGAAAEERDAPAAARGDESLLGEKLTVTGAVMGTPRYMAPEQHRGEPVDARADQFAFCVALYEALHGTPPFVGETYAQLVERVLAGDVPPAPSKSPVPAHVRDAIQRGLARDRDARHGSMNDLLASLTPDRANAAGSRRWPVITAAAAGVALIGALVVALVLRPAPGPTARPPAPPAAPRAVEGAASSLDVSSLQPALAAFDQATVDLAEGAYEAAATGFQDAYAALSVPQIVYDIGVSLYLQGKRDGDPAAYAGAVEAFTRYLASDPMAPGLAERIAVVEREIARFRRERPGSAQATHLAPSPELAALPDPRPRGFVLLMSEPSGATIYIDDEGKGPVGVTPWSGSLTGERDISIARHGYRLLKRRVAMDPERAMVLSVVLAPVSEAEAAP